MTKLPSSDSSRQKVLRAVGLLLAVAFGARLVADLLEPLIPGLAAIAVLCGIAWFLLATR